MYDGAAREFTAFVTVKAELGNLRKKQPLVARLMRGMTGTTHIAANRRMDALLLK